LAALGVTTEPTSGDVSAVGILPPDAPSQVHPDWKEVA